MERVKGMVKVVGVQPQDAHRHHPITPTSSRLVHLADTLYIGSTLQHTLDDAAFTANSPRIIRGPDESSPLATTCPF